MIDTDFTWWLEALPEVHRAGRFPLDERGFPHFYRSETHALHVYDYEGAIRIGPREYVLHPGDATLSPARGETRYDLPKPGHHWCVHFYPVQGKGERCTLPLHMPLGPLRAHVVDGINRISGLLAAPGDGRLARAAASAALQELLLTLAARAGAIPDRERSGRTGDAVIRAAAHLDAHFDEELSVPLLASKVGLSQNWFAKAFRDYHGQTVQHYLLARRIEHAQTLLVTTDLPITRIAARLGFGDSQHFNKQFRRLAGCNPTAYRLRGNRQVKAGERS